jgi:AcrR family transcriptional regulator
MSATATLPNARESWKRLSPEERRSQLMAIAEELFQTRPYAEIGVIDVAKAAGITHGLIYHYFSSKEELFTATFEARAQELVERCSPDQSLPVPEQVDLGVTGYLDYVEAHRVAYLNLFRSVGHQEFSRLCEDTRQKIMARFLVGLGLDQLPVHATRLALRGYIGYIESVVLDWLEKQTVPRSALERLIFAAIGSALRTGFAIDAANAGLPDAHEAFDAYDRYFERR